MLLLTMCLISNWVLQRNSAVKHYDYDQDTDGGSITIQTRPEKKDAVELEVFAHPRDYFEPGMWKEGDAPGTALNFTCKWCKNVYRGQLRSNGNLKTHRDGSTQSDKNQNGCPNRNKAIESGIKLPPSVAETIAQLKLANNNGTQPGLIEFAGFKPVFVNRVLNQLVMLWQIRQALPWSRIEDPYLRTAFLFANPKAVLFGRRWSADDSKKLYCVLKRQVFNELNVCNSQV
jgi:hypothetical protein